MRLHSTRSRCSTRRWTGENCPARDHPCGAVGCDVRPTPRCALPRCRLVSREAGGGSRVPDDAGREGAADAEQRPRDSASRRARLQLVERGAARRCSGARHGVSRTHRARRHVRSCVGAQGGRRHLHRSPCEVPPGDAPTARDRGGAGRRSRPHRAISTTGRRTSTSSGTPAGGAARRPTAKTRT